MATRRPRVKTEEGVEAIRPHEWYELKDLETRIDELLELVSKQLNYANQLLEKILAKPYPPTVIPEVTVAFNNRYKIVPVNLTVANVDRELDLGATANHALVLQCDSPAQWKRNTPEGDPEDLSVGYAVEGYELNKLYITNAAAAGLLRILVEWREA